MAPKAAAANSGAMKATATAESTATSSGRCIRGCKSDPNDRRRGDRNEYPAKRYFFQHRTLLLFWAQHRAATAGLLSFGVRDISLYAV
jgi:hypothetical protein